ncbi:MAG: nitrilase-related carbon-nitrogen hydrolase [Promethearchaeota archaeon]
MGRTRKINIGIIQTQITDNIKDNLENISQHMEWLAKENAEIICLPELFALQYFAQEMDKKRFNLAEGIPGNLSRFLSGLARENKVAIVGGSIFEKSPDGNYYNTCLVFDDSGEIACKYRKMHIPNDPFYYEQFYFAPGDLGYVQAEIKGTKIAPLICYDQWFPEPARINALAGAEIIFYPTAIGWFPELKAGEPFSDKRWEMVMRAHASMNGIFVVAVNRVGKENNLTFWGGSFVADPFGEIIEKASSTDECIINVEIDLEKVFESQDGWGLLKNRRPESYHALIK